jgi:8-oxo-dGTP diphosphatase
MTSPFRLTTLIYALRDGQVLMLYRHKEPNLGLWVAPGGKIHDDESPRECAVRELREETGLEAIAPELRAIVTEVSPRKDWQWLMFVYRTQVASGTVRGDDREGRLRWFPIEAVPHLPIPQADAIFYPFVIDPVGPPVELKFIYDADLRLVAWTHAPIGTGGQGR